MLTPADIVMEARTWLGTPFVKEAAVKGVGVDCVQIGRAVYQAVGILPPDFPDFLPYPAGWLLERGDTRYRDAIAQHAVCVWERGEAPRDILSLAAIPAEPGDLALFRVGRADAHSAIVVTWPRVIHAWDEACVVEADATRNALAARPLASIWRPRVFQHG